MTLSKLKDLEDRPLANYLVQHRQHRVSETFVTRDARYADVDRLLAGEWGYRLPNDETVFEPPMVMNLGLAFTQDVARLVTEQRPAYKAPVYGDERRDVVAAQVREAIAETYWLENRGDLLVSQFAIDLVVCGAAYAVAWIDERSPYPRFTRVDPRHAYPNTLNGELFDLLVVHVMPARVAEALFPGHGILDETKNSGIDSDVEVWEYYEAGYAIRAVAHLRGRQPDADRVTVLDRATYDVPVVPAAYVQLPTHDGAIRGLLDQLGNSLMAKNKIASLMTKYTEHKVFAPWEAKGIVNPTDTPGPNTVYMHNPNEPGETFIRRVEPAGSDPALFALMNLLDLDQRGAIGYPASRQGEVGQSIASAAFVESTQGQLSSIVKDVQAREAQLREDVLKVLFELDVAHLDFVKPLHQAVGKKNTYRPKTDIGKYTTVRVQYGAGSGLTRANADIRILNLLGARLIDRGTARDNIEFLRDRSDVQDKIEAENAEDAIQQLFWPDPSIPLDVKFRVKKLMSDEGLNLTDAYLQVSAEIQEEQRQLAEQAQQAQAQQPQAPAPDETTPAEQQALALEKGAVVSEPADIELPPAPMQQIFVGS